MQNQGLLEYTGNFFGSIFTSFFRKQRNNFFYANRHTIRKIRQCEEKLSVYKEDVFPNIINKFRKKIYEGEGQINDFLIDVFAMVSEASARTLKKRLYDVQLAGGIALQSCNIAEMKTGEGKTLVACLPAVLYSLMGKSVHIVTPNDYLAKRDAENLSPLYNFLGLTVGYIQEDSSKEERRSSYSCDIVYGSNNQFAFDFLKDNLVQDISEKIQGDLFFAIVDEVDNILIDEARTPLIISAPGEDPANYYDLVNDIMYNLENNIHYQVNLKAKNAYLTQKGWETITSFLENQGVNDIFNKNIHLCHYIRNSLKAHKAMILNKDYVVLKKEVVIIDEFTGRLAKGRRYSNGLHQAIEAKEKIEIKQESKNQASISYVAFYKSYEYLCGMTGTAMNDVDEFNEIYNLDVIPIPTNQPVKRVDYNSVRLYRSKIESLLDTAELVKEATLKQQPVLVCTSSVDESVALGRVLTEKQIQYNLLNATNHEKEAYIVAQAGRPGKVTVSTNMAGRGTDIPLGGDVKMAVKEVLETQPDADQEQIEALMEKRCTEEKKNVLNAGGLFVIIFGTPDSQKTEIQIKGRSGRQGDIGKSLKVYSLEDEIILPLYQDKINSIMLDYYFPKNKKFTISEKGNEFVESLQNEYQAYFRDTRKNAFKYEIEFNKQRETYYKYRDYLLTISEKDLHGVIVTYLHQLLKQDNISINKIFENIDLDVLEYSNKFQINVPQYAVIGNNDYGKYFNCLLSITDVIEDNRLRSFILDVFDNNWFDHLIECTNLHSTNVLNHYKNKDPLQEFNDAAIILFQSFINKSVEKTITNMIDSNKFQEDFDFSQNQEEIDQMFQDLLEQTNNLTVEEQQKQLKETSHNNEAHEQQESSSDNDNNYEIVEPEDQ